MGLRLVIRIIVVLCLLKMSLATSLAKPNCQNYCGSVEIIYPFGIGPNCYLDKWFEIECVYGVPHIRSIGVGLYSINNISQTTIDVFMLPGFKDFRGTPFFFSTIENVFVGLGCNIVASLADETENQNAIVWCASVCGSDSYPRPCEASLQENLQLLSPSIQKITTNVTINSTTTSRNTDNSSCELTFVAQQASLDSIISSLSLEDYCFTISSSVWPVTLGYMVDSDALAQHSSNVYGSNLTTDCQTGRPIVKLNNTIISNRSVQCSCKPGYIGNPYLPDGCVAHGQGNKVKWTTFIIGICSALGVLLLIIGGWFLCIAVKKYSSKRRKEKFFKQNGGLLLHQHMSATEGNVHKTKVFSSYELEKATDHYNANRVLGQGGQGTVYKGMLSDGRIVAVKKSKIADPTNVEQFINEVVILSQINQRNIVKLMGCCLETEVPLLVYEFISNGTLYQHIHNPNEEDFTLTWEIRLRIATEIAGALSYLHSAASIPIYHRDIKSTNILLDDKYKARVCDFGTSRSVDIEKTHLTTQVQGTFGYLDPEFFQSGQFTEKSDVYSFGVVLVELLTGHKPIFTSKSQEIRGLAAYFLQAMEGDRFLEMIDPRISNENKIEEMVAVAHIARKCLHLNGRERPTMKEVTGRLEGITMSQDRSIPLGNYGTPASHEIDTEEVYDGDSNSTDTWYDRNPSSSFDVFPLLK